MVRRGEDNASIGSSRADEGGEALRSESESEEGEGENERGGGEEWSKSKLGVRESVYVGPGGVFGRELK
jgi:hypothetical protein